MSKITKSVVWQMILPLPIGLVIAAAAAWWLVPSYVQQSSRDSAINAATQTAGQFKTLRGYYTKNVIKKALANGALKPSFNHKDEPNAIPLPATVIHDLSALLEKEDTQVRLYSAFPFPIRGQRVLDDFENEAWDARHRVARPRLFAI